MNITIATVGTRGDVQPYVALGGELQSAGHQVQIATDSMFQGFIEKVGLGYAACESGAICQPCRSQAKEFCPHRRCR